MLKTIFSLWHRPGGDLRQRFFERFRDKTIIVHDGVSLGWLSELYKEPGGAGHFRFDVRKPVDAKPTPIEWVVHQWVLPQGLPLPALLKVAKDRIEVRHLVRDGHVVHPSEIYWMLKELAGRNHLCLTPDDKGFRARTCLPAHVNDVQYDVFDAV